VKTKVDPDNFFRHEQSIPTLPHHMRKRNWRDIGQGQRKVPWRITVVSSFWPQFLSIVYLSRLC
jgi:hypothetical protein